MSDPEYGRYWGGKAWDIKLKRVTDKLQRPDPRLQTRQIRGDNRSGLWWGKKKASPLISQRRGKERIPQEERKERCGYEGKIESQTGGLRDERGQRAELICEEWKNKRVKNNMHDYPDIRAKKKKS